MFMLILAAGLFFAVPANAANCTKKPDHPQCDGGGDPGGGDPPGNADPQVVYRNDGINLANDDGSSQTQIRTGGVQPKLDAPGATGRVIFYDYPSLGNLNYLGLIPYSIDAGNIVPGEEQILLTTENISPPGISGKFTSRGLTDWSPGGDRYAYNIRQDYGDSLGWRYKVMVAPDGTDSTTFAEHIVVWDGAPDGGLGFGAWDASGDFIYFFEEFNLGVPQILLVIDITTNPATIVKTKDLTGLIGATGFAPESNPQALSASSSTGGTAGGYSFDPGNAGVSSRSDTSLCLMIPLVDWGYSNRHEANFTMIFDLPALFDSGSGLSCPLMTTPTATVLDFLGTDFMTGDTGIIGTDYGKRPYGGVSTYEFDGGKRTKIINDGGFSDWSN